MKTTFNILFLISILLLASCEDMFDYSTYVINFEGENKDVNITNIDHLKGKNNDDTIRIAFTGDSHRFFDELDDFVNSVNELNQYETIDFVIHVGDIADFGLPQQYLWGNSFLLNLDCPYVVVLGNHDMVGNGGLAYSEMFGEYNFSFIYGNTKFVFINTNSREFGFNGDVPDINWLDSQLQVTKDFTNAVVIFHVPPMNDDFDPLLEENFRSTIAKNDNVLIAVHGHLHDYQLYTPYSDSTLYLDVFGVEHRKYNVISIYNGIVEIDTHEF